MFLIYKIYNTGFKMLWKWDSPHLYMSSIRFMTLFASHSKIGSVFTLNKKYTLRLREDLKIIQLCVFIEDELHCHIHDGNDWEVQGDQSVISTKIHNNANKSWKWNRKEDISVQLFIWKQNKLFYRSDCSLFQFGCIYFELI